MSTPALSTVDVYLERLVELLERFRNAQREPLRQAADLIAARLAGGGVLHLFGTGHSHMIAEEVFYRAGGLAAVNAMLDTTVVLSGGAARSTETERTPGAAAQIAAGYDLRAVDAGVVISHSGRNPAPVEMAVLMKAKGMPVIAVTSAAAADGGGRGAAHLRDIADVVLDTGGARGDAALRMPGVRYPVGPTSTVLGAAVVQALMIEVMERLVAAGVEVVNLPSANVGAADLGDVMKEVARLRPRLRHW